MKYIYTVIGLLCILYSSESCDEELKGTTALVGGTAVFQYNDLTIPTTGFIQYEVARGADIAKLRITYMSGSQSGATQVNTGITFTGNEATGSIAFNFTSVTSSDIGNYTLKNSLGEDLQCIQLHISGAVPTVQLTGTNIKNEGDFVTFTCTATSHANPVAPLAYSWEKDGVTKNGETSSSFNISSAATTDSGEYKCIATEDITGGQSSTSNGISLTVIGSTTSSTTTSTTPEPPEPPCNLIVCWIFVIVHLVICIIILVIYCVMQWEFDSDSSSFIPIYILPGCIFTVMGIVVTVVVSRVAEKDCSTGACLVVPVIVSIIDSWIPMIVIYIHSKHFVPKTVYRSCESVKAYRQEPQTPDGDNGKHLDHGKQRPLPSADRKDWLQQNKTEKSGSVVSKGDVDIDETPQFKQRKKPEIPAGGEKSIRGIIANFDDVVPYKKRLTPIGKETIEKFDEISPRKKKKKRKDKGKDTSVEYDTDL